MRMMGKDRQDRDHHGQDRRRDFPGMEFDYWGVILDRPLHR